MINLKDFEDSAHLIKCDVAAIRAVDEVESGGKGFLSSGEPVILFEPHIFWKELRLRGIDPNRYTKGNEDILYPVWGTHPYGKVAQQHARLDRATKINREAALSSASWGRYQILGNNWLLCKTGSLQNFINKVSADEKSQLDLFLNYIQSTHLDDELRNLDWAGFARGFNGPYYTKTGYDKKLARAYKKFKEIYS